MGSPDFGLGKIWGIYYGFCIFVKIKIPEKIPEGAAPSYARISS
jgi:hypothetical protein